MKKTIWLFLLFVCLMPTGCKRRGSSDEIKVGAAIALTGFGSDFGQSEQNAIALLKEKYGDDGKVVFYVEDTKSDVNSGINAIKKLISIHQCDIIYCELSAIVNAASSIVSKAEATLIAPVYLENLNENPFAVRNLPSADQENAALIDYLVDNEIPHQRMAVLFSNDVFGQTCSNSFSRLLPEGSILCHSSAVNEEALRETALKAINAEPDVIYLGSMSETLGLLVKFLRQNGYKKEIITTDAFSYDYINSLAGEYGKGVRYVDFKDTDEYDVFREDYSRRFRIQCVPSAMLCYDGISAVVAAKKEGKELNGTVYEGLTGEISILDGEILYPIQVKTWE
jgi:ABC-type branched-subunit amino acid transport system substrate-binding protein